MGRRERWRLWLTHLPYTLRRWLRPLSRAGLGAWPGPLLWFAAVVVLVGVLWVVPIVPSPGWPPTWDGEPSESRVQLASMILSGVAAFGVVLSIAAGIAEVNKVFPKQQIHFGTGCTWDETGRLVSALTVVNGDAFVEFPRVTAFAEIVKTQGALAVASSPRGRPGRCGGRARGRGAAEAILDARITSGGMEPIVEAGPSCRRGRLQCGQVIAISSSLRGRGYAMLLEP